MILGKSVLGVIPARAGSKGLPGKNKKIIFGKPLISWTIEQANACKEIDRLLVSTNDIDIVSIAQSHGLNVPFVRPGEIAKDSSSTVDVLLHAINWLEENEGYEVGYILKLQPTSPLRLASDISGAIRKLKETGAKAVVSVCKSGHHPWWTNTLPDNECMANFLRPDIINKSRQELPDFYQLNGAIYLAEVSYLKQYGTFFGPDTFAFKMPAKRSVDIDTQYDFEIAKLFMKTQ